LSEGTADLVVRILTDRPSVTMAELVEATGVSRQRIHQILKEKGYRASRRPAVFNTPDGRRPPSSPPAARAVYAPPPSISSTHSGAVSEMFVAADLFARGWWVFHPLTRARCDLIAASHDCRILKRIEVRTGKRFGDKLSYGITDADVCDHYAVVVDGEPVTYHPELAPAEPKPKVRQPNRTTVFS